MRDGNPDSVERIRRKIFKWKEGYSWQIQQSVQQENNSTTFFDHSKRKFSKRDVIGYFVGDFGNNMSFSLISSFMFIFFTQFVGIRLVDYSINIRIKKIFDGINDLVVGSLIVINLKKEINLNPGSNMVVSFLRLPVHWCLLIVRVGVILWNWPFVLVPT